MKHFFYLFISVLIFSCSCGDKKNIEEVTVRGTAAFIVKESTNTNEVLLHFPKQDGGYVAMMGSNNGTPGYDVSDCNWCYIECIISSDSEESCMEACDKIEACKGLVPVFKNVKSVSTENKKLFMTQ